MSQTDNIYAHKNDALLDFSFDEAVADVFPDMINRSVPGYQHIINMAGRIAQQFVPPQSLVYDIGCSLGATSMSISRALPAATCEIVAIDNAQPMVDRCQRRLEQFSLPNPIQVLCADAQTFRYRPCAMITMNFTLQFIDKALRGPLLAKLADAIAPGGLLMLSEKIKHPSTKGNELLVSLHHSFKRDNGYSELEIAQKRAALENVMKTDTIDEHTRRLKEAGFDQVVVWQQQYNFVSMLATKA